jgi:hypothetical protein
MACAPAFSEKTGQAEGLPQRPAARLLFQQALIDQYQFFR